MSSSWRDVKKVIDESKDWGHDWSKQEKSDLEKVYDLASKIDDLRQAVKKDEGNLEKSSCMLGVIRMFVKLIKPHASNPKVKNALEVCDKAMEAIAKGFEVVKIGLALRAFDLNPGKACAAAWGGANIAKTGIDFIRYVAPSLDTDKETKEIENKVFALVGGGAAVGASVGAAIGGAIGLLFGGIGVAPGAAIGAALGGGIGSITGAVILAL